MDKLKQVELTIKYTDTEWQQKKIINSKDAVEICRLFFHEDLTIYESFFMVCCNAANSTIAYMKISQGGTVGTVVDLKIIAKYAIDCLAKSIILCHNHPSGNTNPSSHDDRLTKSIIEGLKIFDILVLDHIILTKDSYYSYGDNGKLY